MAGSNETRFMATNVSVNLSDISLESTILEESAISQEDPQNVAIGDKTLTYPSNVSAGVQNLESSSGSGPTNGETSQEADSSDVGMRGGLTKGTEVRTENEEGMQRAQDVSSESTPSGQTALCGVEEEKAEESGKEALDQIARNGLTNLLTKSAHFMAQTLLDEEESGKILGFISEAFDIGRRLRPRRSRSKKTAPHVEGGKQRTKSQTDQRPKGPRSKSRTKSKVPSPPTSEEKASGPVLPKSKARKRIVVDKEYYTPFGLGQISPTRRCLFSAWCTYSHWWVLNRRGPLLRCRGKAQRSAHRLLFRRIINSLRGRALSLLWGHRSLGRLAFGGLCPLSGSGLGVGPLRMDYRTISKADGLVSKCPRRPNLPKMV
ncbi:hypothetical protein AVEN_84209-1 [Araneus ventricosus]|uniref:Uncharacterized protein n=1 Tax=Araneus ventricosus TaxID=182803 RepID=A0A4Y2L1U8_ARAVE|nr:hypothetical protein AVEN_84209-1 [Araneus ventricosus]